MKQNKNSTPKYRSKSRYKLAIPALVLVCLLLMSPLYSFAAGIGANGSALGLSYTTLGDSTVYSVYRTSDLQEVLGHADDGDYSKIVINLEHDISLADVNNWVPVGTEEKPFNGTIEGNDFVVYGVGVDTDSTFLGHLKDATVQNTHISTIAISDDPNPYYGLLQTAVDSTIVNCKIGYNPLGTISVLGHSGGALRMFAFSAGITADPNWDTAPHGPSSGAIEIHSPGELWRLAELVNSGLNSFANDTITITVDLNCNGTPFDGIGNIMYPFKGSLVGSNININGLTINSTNPIGTGLVAYADQRDPLPASVLEIKGINLNKAKIVGNNATGGLLGYGKDVVITDSSINGNVSGSNDVGGLVGNLVLTVPFLHDDGLPTAFAQPYIFNSYSTANVHGAVSVGGIVGSVFEDGTWTPHLYDESDRIIAKCFSTGNINATSTAGGIVGFLSADTSLDAAFAIDECASISTVTANANAGGLVGKSSGDMSGGAGMPAVINSYFAGTVKANNIAGGLIGFGGGARNSYVSGSVVSPIAFSSVVDASVWPTLGNTNPLEQPGVLARPNTVHRPGDTKNKSSESTLAFADYFANSVYAGSITGSIESINYSDSGQPHGYFTSSSVMVGGSFTNNTLTIDPNFDVTGKFPTLNSFGNSGIYGTFSDLSTDASISTFPSVFYFNNNEAGASDGGVSFELPAGIAWSFSNEPFIEIKDNTLSQPNKIYIDGRTIKSNAPLTSDVSAVITGTIGGIDLKFDVTFKDGALRPVLAKISEEYSNDSQVVNKPIVLDAYMLTLTFSESMDTSAIPTNGFDITLNAYSDSGFSTSVGSYSDGAKIVALNENVIKITIKKAYLKSDTFYTLDFNSNSIKIQDLYGQIFADTYYFRTVSNSAPVITFDETYDLYAKNTYSENTTSSNKEEQYVSVTENDEDYNGYLDGVVVDNPNGQVIDPYDSSYINNYTVAIHDNNSLQGTEGYAKFVDIKADFIKVPGEYLVTYQLPDTEDTTLLSNAAKRYYRVYSKAYFMRGADPYSTITATLTSTDMMVVYNNMTEQGISVDEAVNNFLVQKYLNDASSPDYLAAYRYNYKGDKENMPITFDTSGITNDVFQKGFKKAINIKAGSYVQPMVLDINSTVSDFEIEVYNSTFTCINRFSTSEATRYFNARIRQKSTGKIVNYPLVYDYKKVDRNKYSVAQPITIKMVNSNMPDTINGIDMTVSRKVNVVIIKNNVIKHHEDVNDYVGEFWNTIMGFVKAASQDKILEYTLTYDEAARTPSDFFLIVKNHEGTPITMTLPTDIVLTFRADLIDKSKAFENGITYNLSVEPMYDVYISRDAKGEPIQQFYTADEFALPGAIEVSMPLNEDLPKTGLKLYSIDSASGAYVLEEKISKLQIVDDIVTFEMTEFKGQYVITSLDLEGEYVGLA